jgi:ketosteroid isomerase-like protein
MDEHPNVILVRRALEHVARGELEAVVAVWADESTYFALDSIGPPAEITGRDEILDMMLTGRKFGDHWYETVDVWAVGEEIVVAHMRVHFTATKTNESVVGDYLGVYRVQDGKIVMGCDFVDSGVQQFLADTWDRLA